jgi:hypothetical protein
MTADKKTEEKKTPLLVSKELFSDAHGLSSRINWTNSIKKYVIESPGFLPYFRSWFWGKTLSEIMKSYELPNVVGLASSSPEVLQRVISTIRETVPYFDPFALIDPRSEAVYRSLDQRDQSPIGEDEGLSADILNLIANRSRRLRNIYLGTGATLYSNMLRLIYTPDTAIGWLDTQIRKQIAAGAKIAVPMFPCITNNESKNYWKGSYVALKSFYIKTDDIDGKSGIPLALHIPINHSVFKETGTELLEEIYRDIEELKPSAITIKIVGGANLDNREDKEKAQRIKDFLEHIGRTAKALGIFTHLFCENTSGIRSFNLGLNTFSQPIDHKEIRLPFASRVPPSAEQKFGSIYDYKKKRFVSHKTWLNETEELGHPSCPLKCCKGKTFIAVANMTHFEFYRYAGRHLILTRNLEITEFIQAIRTMKVSAHLIQKFGV